MSRIAFLGLGRMGGPMARNLVGAGHEVVAWNRTSTKADAFAVENGAISASTPREAASAAEFVISMLADDAALLDAYHGPDGVLAGLPEGAVAIDMSTVSPQTARSLASEAAKQGVSFVDAPVSGAVAAATAATLTIMAGGEPEAVERARPVLASLGDPVIHLGETGAGAAMKLVVNSIVHSLNGAVSEALVLAEKAGISREAAYAVFLNSAVSAPFVHYRQASFETPQDVPVMFRLQLAHKDIRLAIELADEVGADLPQATTNLAVLTEAMEAGFSDSDESAVAEYLRTKTKEKA